MLMTAEMVRGFDPYRAWLGVCEMRRPLTAYQLLDLAPLEEDLDTIRQAAGEKRAALESHRDEAPLEVWLQVHEELEEAIGILLDPDKKTAYDLALHQIKHSHAAPHGPTGGVTDKSQGAVFQCPVCQAANPATRKFCVHCGTNLWEPCFECSTLCSAGEKYCGACGAHIGSSLTEHTKRFELAFRDAEQLRAVNRFDDAIALLRPMAQNDHPRLATYAAKAAQLIGQLNAQLSRRQIVAEEALQRAEQAFAGFDYAAASRILADVPRSLLSDAMNDLLRRISERQQEIETLDNELHEAVRSKRVLDLLPRINRLLAIKPDHPYAQGLSEKVQRHMVDVAEKRLSQHQYDGAKHLLDQIDPDARSPRASELHRQAAELAWLTWDLRHAPVVDKTLLVVAERLLNKVSNNPQVAKLCDLLQRRNGVSQGPPVPWAQPPKDAPLGIAIDWLAGLQRIRCAETFNPAELWRHPGRFAVACGLALAGVKQAAILLNLLASEQQSMLTRVSQFVRSRNARSAWGLDLSASGLKAIKLTWNEAKQQTIVETALVIEHAKPLAHAANDAEEKKLIGETLGAFLDRQPNLDERICVGLPSRLALCRQIDVPPGDPAKIPKLIQFEARNQFPLPMEQLAWDFHLFDSAPGISANSRALAAKPGCRAFVLGSQRAAIQKYLDVFRQLNLRIDLMQTDVLGLHNFLVHEHFEAAGHAPTAETSHVASVDIGCDTTNIVVSSPQSHWFRACPIGGQNFTRAIVKEFNLGIAQAEQLKRSPESAEHLSVLYDAMSPVFEDLVSEVQQSLAMYAKAHPEQPVRRLLGVGGGFALHGLFRYLRCGR